MKHWKAALCLVSALFILGSPAQSGEQEPSATGSGMIRSEDGFRNFSFTAHQKPDGSVRGQAQLKNRNFVAGATVSGGGHIVIDCLSVQGHVATMSGTLVRHTDPDFVGHDIWFQVHDNGEGGDAPIADQISLVSIFPPGTGPTCEQANPFAVLNDITAGNVQVHN